MTSDVTLNPRLAVRDDAQGGFARLAQNLLPVLVPLGGYLVFSVWSHVQRAGINVFETGVYLAGGQRILGGQKPYVDFFSIYGPGVYYFAAAALRLTPNVVDAGWLLFQGMDLIDACLVYLLVRRLVASRLAQGVAIFACLTFASSTFRMTLPLAALVAAVESREGTRRWVVMLSGFLSATTILVQQDTVAFTFGALVAWFALLGWTTGDSSRLSRLRGAAIMAGLYLSSFVAALLLVALLLARQGMLNGFVQNAFGVTLKYYDKFSFGRFPRPFEVEELEPGVSRGWSNFGVDKPARWFFYTLPFYFVPMVYVVTLLIFGNRARRGKLSPSIWAALLVALFGLMTFRPVLKTGELPKLMVNSAPAAVLGMFILFTIQGFRFAGIVRMTCVASVLIFCLYRPLKELRKSLDGKRETTGMRAKVTSEDYHQMRAVIEFVRSRNGTGTSVFCYPNCPLTYVVGNFQNPTKFDYFDPIIAPVIDGPALDQLKLTPPRFCVYRPGFKFWKVHEFGYDFGTAIQAWIEQEYHVAMRCGEFVVWEHGPRNTGTPPIDSTAKVLTTHE